MDRDIYIQKAKAKYLELLRKSKEGCEHFIEWLESTDFFTAPASTQYHSSYVGGLVTHSLYVAERMQKRLGTNHPSAIFVALVHDICKANFYVVSSRNVKNEETGKWEKQPYYTVEDQLPYGHGDKSVYLLMKYGVELTDEEAMAIRHHMGAYEIKPGDYTLGKAFEKYPLALHLHLSDMEATYFDEAR